MATRRPLVYDRTAGSVEELPATDSLPGGGGAGLSASSVTVSPPVKTFAHYEVLVSVPSASPSSKVLCWLAPNDDFEADELCEYQLVATPLAAQIQFTISTLGAISGNFLIHYAVI
jgi:hypothetical protein